MMGTRLFGRALGQDLGAERIADLTERVKADIILDWDGIEPYVRDTVASYRGRVYGIPGVIAGASLFYRKDLFCQGPRQGLYFKPSKLISGNPLESALIKNVAMQHALSMYATFANSGPWPRPPSTNPLGRCVEMDESQRFSRGECLMVFGPNTLKVIHSNPELNAADAGVVPTPGVAHMLDRAANVFVDCTPALCPYAEQGVDPATGAVRWVNRAPVWHTADVVCVSSQSPPVYQNLSYEFLRTFAVPGTAWMTLLDKDAPESQPYRTEHFTDLQRWRASGYDESVTAAWLAAIRKDMNNNNSVPDLRLPGVGFLEKMMNVYTDGASKASLMRNADGIVDEMDVQMRAMLHDTSIPNLELLRSSYATILEYVAPPVPPSPLAPPQVKSMPQQPPYFLVVELALPILGLLLLIAAVVVVKVCNKKRHRNIWGKAQPPCAGPDTALVVTEVDGAAALWDSVSADVMNEAMLRMSAALDALLTRHSGARSGNDMRALRTMVNSSTKLSSRERGDVGQYVFAFHEVKDALQFTMEAQSALLHVQWPAELLLVPVCAPKYVQLVRFDLARQPPARFAPSDLDGIFDADDAPTGDTSLAVSRTTSTAVSSALPVMSVTHNQAIPALTNLPPRVTYTFAEACRRVWAKSMIGGPDHVLVMRGLALNMGIHTELCEADTAHNAGGGASCVAYSGPSVDAARTIVSAARLTTGGLVIMGAETYKRLPLERLLDKHLVLHVGDFTLSGGTSPSAPLYYALSRLLEGRLGIHLVADGAEERTLQPVSANGSECVCGPPRQLDAGVFTAPVGLVTIAFMNVVGAQTLLSWDARVAQPALKRFHSVVSELLREYDGYLIEAVDGLFLASFSSPENAIPWALKCNEAMISVDWGEALLRHELCEELFVSTPAHGGLHAQHSRLPRTATESRHRRWAVGQCGGEVVLSEVHAMAGRLTYRGKVINRAARIASTAQSGQVLCSSGAWEVAAASLEPSSRVSATSLGKSQLKGVSTKMELFHCHVAAATRRRSSLMHGAAPWAAAAALLGGGGGGGSGGICTLHRAHTSKVLVGAAGGHRARGGGIVASASGHLHHVSFAVSDGAGGAASDDDFTSTATMALSCMEACDD
ncbi:hypothetical protein FOA52_007434 [Chlamydomonas sp. UWO 241]|nr:hypothetical protein FOA52_007434 [Chlamydomonas sp. UWO 241]